MDAQRQGWRLGFPFSNAEAAFMAKKKASGSSTPRQRNCGTMQQHFYLLETVPSFRANLVALEHACQARLRMAAVARVTPYKINVVVHVVHNPAVPSEKISEA